ncbi:MAG: ABC transporter ATP-binding protein, partial [Eggerthellales bacterium]|nr:ABC transporter ATP-binding protein [Eggerthellales bacterium]
MLEIRNLTKTFGQKVAVDDLSLRIAPGEIFGFIGHNGAGKTTTLKCVAGIQNYDAGQILVDGIDMAVDPLAGKRQIAYLQDNPDLYDFMTGLQYLNFVADIFQVPADVRRARI